MNLVIGFLIFIFGTCIGSFLNVVIWRLPREEKITGRSHCAKCGHQLKARDLFPLLSFFLLFGRCRNCGEKISFRYPLLEAVTGLLFVSAYLIILPANYFSYFYFVKSLLVIAFLIPIFVIDLEHFLILDSVLFLGIGLITAINFYLDFILHNTIFSFASFGIGGLIAGITGMLPFLAIWFFSKGKWMGFGDVKLALFLGVAVGWSLIWVNLFLGVVLGGLTGFVLLLFGGKTLKSKLPFGTFLSLAAVLTMFYGHALLAWYLGILGV